MLQRNESALTAPASRQALEAAQRCVDNGSRFCSLANNVEVGTRVDSAGPILLDVASFSQRGPGPFLGRFGESDTESVASSARSTVGYEELVDTTQVVESTTVVVGVRRRLRLTWQPRDW